MNILLFFIDTDYDFSDDVGVPQVNEEGLLLATDNLPSVFKVIDEHSVGRHETDIQYMIQFWLDDTFLTYAIINELSDSTMDEVQAHIRRCLH